MAVTNSKVGSDLLLRAHVGTNCQNLMLRQLGVAATLASVVGAVSSLVGMVLLGCSPSEIFKPIVVVVAVVMAALLIVCRRADESKKDGSMNLDHLALVLSPKENLHSSFRRIGRLLHVAGARVANAAMVGYFVESAKANYRFPCFHNSYFPTHGDMVQAQ